MMRSTDWRADTISYYELVVFPSVRHVIANSTTILANGATVETRFKDFASPSYPDGCDPIAGSATNVLFSTHSGKTTSRPLLGPENLQTLVLERNPITVAALDWILKKCRLETFVYLDSNASTIHEKSINVHQIIDNLKMRVADSLKHMVISTASPMLKHPIDFFPFSYLTMLRFDCGLLGRVPKSLTEVLPRSLKVCTVFYLTGLHGLSKTLTDAQIVTELFDQFDPDDFHRLPGITLHFGEHPDRFNVAGSVLQGLQEHSYEFETPNNGYAVCSSLYNGALLIPSLTPGSS